MNYEDGELRQFFFLTCDSKVKRDPFIRLRLDEVQLGVVAAGRFELLVQVIVRRDLHLLVVVGSLLVPDDEKALQLFVDDGAFGAKFLSLIRCLRRQRELDVV